jgi:hypothetical protein
VKLNEELYAIVKPDGDVAGDGESSCIYLTRESAESALRNDNIANFGDFLRSINGTDDLRIVRCKLVPLAPTSPAATQAKPSGGAR